MALIVCNGMPRSGSTLQYNIVRAIVVGAEIGEAHGFVTSETGHSQEASMERLSIWGMDGRAHVIKTHELLPALPALAKTNLARVFYIYRDLRDVAVSMKRAFGKRGSDLMNTLEQAVADHQTLDALRAHYSPLFLWQRYEDVHADLRRAIRESGEHLGLALGDESIDAVASVCQLDAVEDVCRSVRAKLEEHIKDLREVDPAEAARFVSELRRDGGSQLWMEPNRLLHYNHISPDKGAPGVWRERLTDGEIDAIHSRFGDWLKQNGYPLD